MQVHSEHDWQEQSDAPIIVSRFPFRSDEYFAACGGSAAFGSENHTTAPAARWKCTPIPLRGLPPEGEVLAAHYLELLMSSTAEQRVKFPLRGKGGALAPKGVHFHRPPGRLYGFNYYILIAAKGGDTFPFEPSAPFEPSEPITANDSSVPSSFDSSLTNLFLTNFFHLCYNSLNTLHAL